MRNQQTKELIDEISIAGIPAIETKPKVGTFGCKELIYAYAMWISPSFHLKVIRAYDQMQQQPSVMPGQVERVAMGDPITPEELAAVLARPVIISASEYLSLTQGKSSGNQIAEHSNGQHYSDEVRAEVLDLGDKGWMPAEITDRTGVPIATVRTMLFRARKAGKISKGPKQGTLARDEKKGGGHVH